MANVDESVLSLKGAYYNIDVFIKHCKLDRPKVYNILQNSKERYVIDNLFVFKGKYYITMVGLLFIVYMYRIPFEHPKSKKLFTELLDNITNLKTFSYKLLGTHIMASDLPYYTDRVLVMDNKEQSAYVCMFQIENSLKLGVSYSPKVRFEYEITAIKEELKDDVKLKEIYHFANFTIAKQAISQIKMTYYKMRNKDGNFRANGNVRNMINNRYSGHRIL